MVLGSIWSVNLRAIGKAGEIPTSTAGGFYREQVNVNLGGIGKAVEIQTSTAGGLGGADVM